jgi:hypothetical protein
MKKHTKKAEHKLSKPLALKLVVPPVPEFAEPEQHEDDERTIDDLLGVIESGADAINHATRLLRAELLDAEAHTNGDGSLALRRALALVDRISNAIAFFDLEALQAGKEVG